MIDQELKNLYVYISNNKAQGDKIKFQLTYINLESEQYVSTQFGRRDLSFIYLSQSSLTFKSFIACIFSTSEILLEDNTYKRIDELTTIDKIMTPYGENTGIKHILKCDIDESTICIVFEKNSIGNNKKIFVDYDHPINNMNDYLRTKILKPAYEYINGSDIYASTYKKEYDKMENNNIKLMRYDIITENNEDFIANNVVIKSRNSLNDRYSNL